MKQVKIVYVLTVYAIDLAYNGENVIAEAIYNVLGCFRKREQAVLIAHKEAKSVSKRLQIPFKRVSESKLELEGEFTKVTFRIEEREIDKEYTEEIDKTNVENINNLN